MTLEDTCRRCGASRGLPVNSDNLTADVVQRLEIGPGLGNGRGLAPDGDLPVAQRHVVGQQVGHAGDVPGFMGAKAGQETFSMGRGRGIQLGDRHVARRQLDDGIRARQPASRFSRPERDS